MDGPRNRSRHKHKYYYRFFWSTHTHTHIDAWMAAAHISSSPASPRKKITVWCIHEDTAPGTQIL